MPTTPRQPVERDLALDDDFESDQETPVFAIGTRHDIVDPGRIGPRATTLPGVPDDDVASLAHDLKNPLTIILLETSQIEERLAPHMTPAVLRGLERIAQNATYIDRLVSDLLDVASADAGRLELRLERLDLARLLSDSIERAVATPDRARVQLDIREVLYAHGDETRIERVVSNFLNNAFKYCPHGLVTLRLESRGGYACVSVTDAGPGLTSEESRRVFERYRRQTTGTQHGYGLGLYTSRKIIEAHRGRIGIVSKSGEGSRFFFELPLISAVPSR